MQWRLRAAHFAGRQRYQVAMTTRISRHRGDYDIETLHSAAAAAAAADLLCFFAFPSLEGLTETQ